MVIGWLSVESALSRDTLAVENNQSRSASQVAQQQRLLEDSAASRKTDVSRHIDMIIKIRKTRLSRHYE